jgi:orotidine-5'-phosphate decarboxylase
VPGIGAQGGDAEAAVEYGLADGVGLINSSRGIIFAGEDNEARRASNSDAATPRSGGEEFAAASGQAAKRLKKRLNRYRD